MKNFTQFLTEGIRQGLPHITTMDHEQFKNLTAGGKVHLGNVTEKTDGRKFEFGHDEKGFFTQGTGSGSEKMRTPQDHIDRAKRRAKETGKPYDPKGAEGAANIHATLQTNHKLLNHLRIQHQRSGKEARVSGEAFYLPDAKPSEKKGEIKFVGTSYDPSHMGSKGKFVIHSQLPVNKEHNLEHFKKHLSSPEMNFDDDKINHTPTSIDVGPEHEQFNKLNHALLKARTTPKNKAEKMKEIEKFEGVKRQVSAKIDQHVRNSGVKGKWGSGSEGLVVHPTEKNPNAPRFKVTSDAFRQYRESDAAKTFKSAGKK